MLATDLLTAHHNLMRDLMRQLGQVPADSPKERRRLLDVLMTELELHDRVEHEIFYPAMREVSALVPIAHAEQRQIIDQLAVLLRTDPRTERFAEELRVLRARVEQHAGIEEESRMFPDVMRKVDQADLHSLGDQLAARFDDLRRSRLTRSRLRLKRAVIRRL
jgi:hypothetical protein